MENLVCQGGELPITRQAERLWDAIVEDGRGILVQLLVQACDLKGIFSS